MQELHLPSLDMNLVVALDALLSEENVTRAAAKVGISQSAMSHALGRLRALTGDAILVRGPEGMVPTNRARGMAAPVRRALAEVRAALAPPRAFDPETAEVTVSIGTSDYGEIVFLPALVRRLAAEAPSVDVRLVRFEQDAPRVLGSGKADVIIAPRRAMDDAKEVMAKKLWDERFVCVARRGHPLSGERLTLKRYAAASHVLIAPRGSPGGYVDDALAKLSLRRRVAVMTPHFMVAPYLVAASDHLLTLPGRVAALVSEPLGLEVMKLPGELGLEGFGFSLMWHERTAQDAAQAWLREQIALVTRSTRS